MNDTEARNRLVEEYMPLAAGVLKRTNAGRKMHPDDRRQEAMLGLIRALDSDAGNPDVPLDVRLWSAIRRDLSDAGRRDRLIAPMRSSANRRGLTDGAREASERTAMVASLWGEGADRIDPIDREDGTADVAERESLSEAAHRLADGLSPRVAVVFRARMRGASYKEIAAAIGDTVNRVIRTEAAAVRTLRRHAGIS